MSKNSVKLSTNVNSVAVNGYAKLTFNFNDVPVGFTLDDIKVTNGVITNLVQDNYNPLLWTALFTPGNNNRPNSTIKLDGDYISASGKGTPSNTLVLKTDPVAIIPTISFANNNVTVIEGNEGVKSFTYTVSLSTAVVNPVTVNYTTTKQIGTAKAGSDFVDQTGSITFNPGETSKTFTVDIIGDTVYEGKEYFYTHLINPIGGTLVENGAEGFRSSWVMTYITNDDILTVPTVGFDTNNFSVTEGNEGVKQFNFVAKLDKASTEVVTVNYTTTKQIGTAKAGSDFIDQSGSITFNPGETSKVINIDVIGDTIYEGKEYFYLHMTSAINGNLIVNGAEGLRSSWAMGYIINDDVNPNPTVGFATNNFSTTEGNLGTKEFNFVATLSKASTEVVTVNYTTAKQVGTAKAGSDFVSQTGSIIFNPGETSKIITVNVIGDTTYEGKEYFYLHMTSAVNADLVVTGSEGLRSSWGMGYINNDDLLGSVGPATIYGTLGKDTLGGTSGEDILDGMSGQDMMTGYAGADLFVLSSLYSEDTFQNSAVITDFKDGEDRIALKDGLNFEGIVITQNGENTLISFSNENALATLIGVNSSDLGINDFVVI